MIPWENAPDDLAIDQSGNWYNTFMVGYVQVLACPIVYYLANAFLDGFAYRIALSFLLFGAVGLGIFILLMLVVSVLSGRVALENPVHALKED